MPTPALRPPAPFLYWVGALLVSLLVSGCAHYRLGTGTDTKFQTLFIAPAASTTLIPQSQALITTQIREAFLKDARVTLVNSPAEADAVLAITLVQYQRDVVVSLPNDTGLARRYDLTLDARATLTDTRTRQIYFTDRPLTAKRGAFTDNGLIPAEYQVLPLLAEQLATEAVHATLDVW